jgi:hypothetical protein
MLEMYVRGECPTCDKFLVAPLRNWLVKVGHSEGMVDQYADLAGEFICFYCGARARYSTRITEGDTYDVTHS